jgi:hypothetical protein
MYEEFDLEHIPQEYEEDEMTVGSFILSARGGETDRGIGSPGGINRVRGFDGVSPSKKRTNEKNSNYTSIVSFASNPNHLTMTDHDQDFRSLY